MLCCQVIFIKVDSLLSAPKDERSVLHYACLSTTKMHAQYPTLILYVYTLYDYVVPTLLIRKGNIKSDFCPSQGPSVVLNALRSVVQTHGFSQSATATYELKRRGLITGQEFPLKLQMSLKPSSLQDSSYTPEGTWIKRKTKINFRFVFCFFSAN